MAEQKPSNGVAVPPESVPAQVTREEIHEQLAVSRAIQEEGAVKAKRAEQTAGDMASVLRRIAAAMDRNPQSWDDLFLKRERP